VCVCEKKQAHLPPPPPEVLYIHTYFTYFLVVPRNQVCGPTKQPPDLGGT